MIIFCTIRLIYLVGIIFSIVIFEMEEPFYNNKFVHMAIIVMTIYKQRSERVCSESGCGRRDLPDAPNGLP